MGTVESRVKQRTKCERVDYGVGVQLTTFGWRMSVTTLQVCSLRPRPA